MQVEKRNATAVAGIEEHVAEEVVAHPRLPGDFRVDKWKPQSLIELGGLVEVTAGVGDMMEPGHVLNPSTLRPPTANGERSRHFLDA